ncbi:amidohydrolase family protein [Streptomyces sp. P38-E01]|uniref:Amidohydrolase family protein n=1 Tax=Streptomyces tardus TaxID=2780544 RepID=A0A949N6J9_9ACTN|nr:amidohydrolase family protein [Streptomyces tardus]MBU7600094.1 amidohydrolase family protein [Streptomyces tardus]
MVTQPARGAGEAAEPAQLVVRGARLADRTESVDILVREGRFARIGAPTEGGTPAAAQVIDAGGRLVVPPFVDAHMHLDSALTLDPADPNRSGTLREGIEVWGRSKARLTGRQIHRNAREVLRWMVAAGTLHVRCHVDMSPGAPDALSALIDLREEARGVCDLQLVAFPQDGLLREPGQREALRAAMARGCDVVGGIPHYERTPRDAERHVREIFDVAQEFDADVDPHCDETDDPGSRLAEAVARETLTRGWQGRVALGHCTAMAAYCPDTLASATGLLARAGIAVVANPMVNAVLQGRGDPPPVRRGMAPVAQLLEAGVTVAFGQDSVLDAWLPLGTGDMLAVAQTGALFGHLTGYEQLAGALDLVTCSGARTMRLGERYGIVEGRPADFVLLDACDPVEALRLLPARLHVVRHGREVARTSSPRGELVGGFAPGAVDLGRHR